jgi:YD repeat-containing protein
VRTNVSLLNGNNTFVATASDASGRSDTNTVTMSLPTPVTPAYDSPCESGAVGPLGTTVSPLAFRGRGRVGAVPVISRGKNGNLTSDGYRAFAYDDADQLAAVQVANVWRSEFVYDALGRRRIRREKVWKNSQWMVAAEVRYVHYGMLVIQEPPTPRGIGASTPRHVSVGWRCSGLSVAGYGGPRRDGNNVPTVSYTRGRDLSGTLRPAGGIGGLLAMSRHSTPVATHSFDNSWEQYPNSLP